MNLSSFNQFRWIQWPLIRSEVKSTAVMVFMYCLRSFTVVMIFGGGPSLTTIEVGIFQALNYDFNISVAAQLALSQLFINVFMYRIFSKHRKHRKSDFYSSVDKALVSRCNFFDYSVLILCASLFILPLGLLVFRGVSVKKGFFRLFLSPEFYTCLHASFLIGIVVTVITIIMAISLIQMRHESVYAKGRLRACMSYLPDITANSSLFISPIVVGTGLLFFVYQWNANYYVVFSLICLLNVITILPSVYRILYFPLTTKRDQYDQLCHVVKVSGFRRWWLIDWPLIRQPMSYAIATSLVFSLGDSKSILFFNNGKVKNLTMLIYDKMQQYQFSEASQVAALIILISYFGFFLSRRFFEKAAN